MEVHTILASNQKNQSTIKKLNEEVTSKDTSIKSDSLHHNFFNLQNILELFNFPINEDQAWAICYQSIRFFQKSNIFFNILEFSQILLYENGEIIIEIQKDTTNTEIVAENDAIFSLGMIIFNALDYGLSEEEENFLHPQLQHLISSMTNLTKDIKFNKSNEKNTRLQEDCNINKRVIHQILKMCIDRLQVSNNDVAETYYKKVIHSLFNEALEISNCLNKEFMEQEVSKSNDVASTKNVQSTSLEKINSIRFWSQIIGEVDNNKPSIHKILEDVNNDELNYKLEPLGERNKYELKNRDILMSDIRQRRYCLKKISDSSVPFKRDAFSTVLDFVKSKPQLRKASERVLPPIKKEHNLHELLMESIKRPPKPLKPSKNCITTNRSILWLDLDTETTNKYLKGTESFATYQNMRKLIPVDYDFKLDDDTEYDESDVNSDSEGSTVRKKTIIHKNNKRLEKLVSENNKIGSGDNCIDLWKINDELHLTTHEYHKFCDSQLEFYDLATQCPSRTVSARKHKVQLRKFSEYSKDDTANKLQENFSKECIKIDPEIVITKKPIPKPRNNIERNKIPLSSGTSNKKGMQHCLNEIFLEDRLSLTLEEIVHIRNVLTKAELESLPIEGCVKEDVEKRRICFLCLKTRFGILGPWGQRCRICEMTICVKCYSKMKIPTEHFSQIPVLLLSPSLLISPLSGQLELNIKNSWSKNDKTFGSAPTSPAIKRQNSEISKHILTKSFNETKYNKQFDAPNITSNNIQNDRTDIQFNSSERTNLKSSSPTKFSISKSLSRQNRSSGSQEISTDHSRGILMVVCHDCRLMVVQIIKNSQSTRANIRNNVISRLTLNLSPVYV